MYVEAQVKFQKVPFSFLLKTLSSMKCDAKNIFVRRMGLNTPAPSHVAASLDIIQRALRLYPGRVGVCFNGGKDSSVLLDLVERVRKAGNTAADLKYIHFRCDGEFQEICDYLSEVEKSYQIRITHILCNSIKDGLKKLLQKHQMKAMLMGVRRSDPEGKDLEYFQKTTNGYENIMRVSPLLHWSYRDIWNYIDENKVPVCKLYADGYSSIGNVDNTMRNPMLKKNGVYIHAKYLENGDFERIGRK